MWVKICGTTNLADAQLAVGLGAEALGFIFAPSKRRVSVEQVAAITVHLPPAIERVGVFTEPNGAEIARTVREAGLSAVQLHMQHDASFTSDLRAQLGAGKRLIQVVPVPVDAVKVDALQVDPKTVNATDAERRLQAFVATLRAVMSDRSLWAVLLDTQRAGQSGGLGIAFSWEAVRPYLAEVLASAAPNVPYNQIHDHEPPRVILAGGLDPGNVGQAIDVLRPWGVDVVSGVEQAPGHKAPERLAAFVSAAKLST